AERRSWDTIFRSLLVGPWKTDADKGAKGFLLKRAKNLDALTSDASRAFFGVDITCARCHDHPLVTDWKQDHYYGLASFFHRTQAATKTGEITEKPDGELTFNVRGGGQHTAQLMYLTGLVVDAGKQDGAKKKDGSQSTRRELLVDAALAERSLFSRAA